MLALTLRGLAARKLRAALTALAIFFGVAMVAGTLMLTDTINRSFDNIFTNANEGVDVSVKPREAVGGDDHEPPAFDAGALERVREVDGVEEAAGAIFDSSISILDENEERIGPQGPPHLASSVLPDRFNPWSYNEGRGPEQPGEVAIDRFTAEEEGYRVGDRVPIAGDEPARRYEVTGIGRFGSDVPLAGASIALFTLEEAQRITGKEGEFDEIVVAAESGLSPEELKSRVAAALPSSLVARTGEETAAEESEDLKSGFSFFSTALLAFAAIALFVGGFLIFNTFSITVAQRTHEFGMLRTIGASARQVLVTVLLEAVLIGLVASLAGIAGGIAFVSLITALFEALGFELPSSGLILNGRTIAVALAVGVLSTVAASAVPAIRATRVAPLEALRTHQFEGAARPGRRRTLAGAALCGIGAALIALGLFATDTVGAAFQLFGPGLVLLFLGVALLGRTLIRPVAAGVGWPLERARGVTGRLARENTLRNPARTTTTAAALMIGVALVTFVGVFASSLSKSFDEALDQAFAGDVVLQNADQFSGVPPGAARSVGKVDGVRVVSRIGSAPGRVQGVSGTQDISGIEASTIARVGNIDWREGSDETLERLESRGAIVESEWADDQGIEVGDRVEITTPTERRVSFTVAGSARDETGLLVESIGVSRDVLAREFAARDDEIVLLGFAPGTNFEDVRSRVDAALSLTFPNVESRSERQLKEDQREQINQLLVLVYALLALSIVISLFGVVNTLALTIRERTRELGMLRAIGTSRRQVREMIRYESVITAMIGAIIGAVIGLALAVIAVTALEDEGFVLSIPVPVIVVMLVLAAVAGVLAAIAPARRASRLNVIEALQYE